MRKHVKGNVSWVGFIDWELESFHGDDYSIMNGSSQNAYLIEEEKGGTENSIQFDMFNSLDEQVNSEDNASRKLITINKVSKDHWIVTAKIPAINDKNYVIEKPVLGYSTIYKNVGEHYGETDRCYAGGTIINTKIPKTGDDSRLKLFLTLFCISAVLLALNKRTTDSR